MIIRSPVATLWRIAAVLIIVSIAMLTVSFVRTYLADEKRVVLWSDNQGLIINIAIKGEIDPDAMAGRLSSDHSLAMDYAKWFLQARPFNSAIHCRWFAVVLGSGYSDNILNVNIPSGGKISWDNGMDRARLCEFISESSNGTVNNVLGSLVISEISELIATPAVKVDGNGRLSLLVRLMKILPSSYLANIQINCTTRKDFQYSVADGIKVIDEVIDWSIKNTRENGASESGNILLQECARKLSEFLDINNVPSLLLKANDLGTMKSAFTRLLAAHGDDETIVNIVNFSARPFE